ncbi:unnamed protein product, partial [Prorocentrum cordatum]
TEKVRWLKRFIMDPKTGGCVGRSKTEIKRTREDAVIDVWVTLDVLGGPLYLNNKEHALAMIADLESRPHKRSRALRDLGILEYHYVCDGEGKLIDSTSHSASVEVEASMEADDYER